MCNPLIFHLGDDFQEPVKFKEPNAEEKSVKLCI